MENYTVRDAENNWPVDSFQAADDDTAVAMAENMAYEYGRPLVLRAGLVTYARVVCTVLPDRGF